MGVQKLKILSVFCTTFVALVFYSCSDSQDDSLPNVSESRLSINEPSVSCRVNSFSIKNMFFDELKNIPFTFNPSFTGRLNLSYNIGNNKISQVSGGLANISVIGSTIQYPFMWSNNVLENVVYEGNSITVNSDRLYSKRFVIVNNKLVSQLTTYDQSLFLGDYFLNYAPELLTYEYLGNTIVESRNNSVRRIFYLDNRNLTKVELFFRNGNGDILKKIEYLLSNYNNSLNLLKGKFFINGNFFAAFSRNNFGRIEMNTYNLINGQYELVPSGYSYFNVSIPTDMYIQDCN